MWKHADIIPVPKVKPASDVNKNLRPISLMTSISKVAEEFVKTLDPDQYRAIPMSSSVLREWSQATN
jgi:hypothetical protein